MKQAMLGGGIMRIGVTARAPGWTHGRPIPAGVLDEIFSDRSITSMVSGKPGTAEGLDVKI